MTFPAAEVKRLIDFASAAEQIEDFNCTLSGEEIERLLKIVQTSEYYKPVGVRWDSTSSDPTLTVIDINGTRITPTTTWFDNHWLWGDMELVVRNRSTGVISKGSNPRGDGLTIDGTAGDVLVKIRVPRYLYTSASPYRYLWFFPDIDEYSQLPYYPAAYQRGGVAHPVIYVGAKEASFRVDSSGNILLQSVAGVLPATGSRTYNLAFTSGNTAFTVGETITGATSGATGTVIAFYKVSGDWAAGTASGNVYLQPCSASAATPVNFSAAENITRTSGSAVATAAATAISLNIDQAEDYANAIGSGFGITNIWTQRLIAWMMAIEGGSFNTQYKWGKGVVDLNATTGSPLACGADSIDLTANAAENGTGRGTGTDGLTPVKYRSLENPGYGNVWEWQIGLNANADGSYHILNRDGAGTTAAMPATLTSDMYDTITGLPTTAGFISGLSTDERGFLAGLASAVVGDNSTYLCDYHTPSAISGSAARVGGRWSSGNFAGPFMIDMNVAVTLSDKYTGCRIEYYPEV